LETDEDKYNFGNPLIIKCQEVLRVGDVITYYHEFWVNQRKVAKIQKIKPDEEFKLVLDTNDVLPVMHSIKRMKKTINDGTTVDIIVDDWRLLGEYQLIEGEMDQYHRRKSLEAMRLEKVVTTFNDDYSKLAKESGLPVDLVNNTNQGKRKQGIAQIETEHVSVEEGLHMDGRATTALNTIECSGNDDEEASESIHTHQINYHKMLDQSLKQRTSIEKVASNGQKKQAEQVNKGRVWHEGENIPKDTVCILCLGRDRNKVGIKNLPVVVWKQVHYQKSGSVRYQLCSRIGYLKGTYGREELEPIPHLTAELMGIDTEQHDNKKTITALEAHEMYLAIGGKRSFCRCAGNCATSKSCKCRRMNKLCTSRCHNKQENALCKLCIM
jgi:hypothetical protein